MVTITDPSQPAGPVRVSDLRALFANTVSGLDRFESLQLKDLFAAAALGLVPGVDGINKFGKIPTVTSALSPATVWFNGGIYPWQAGTFTLEGFSASPADADPAGAGMRTARVQGLDTNWALQSKDFALAGAGVVAIPGTWRRVFRVFGLTNDPAVESNAGNITVRITGAGAVQAVIEATAGQTEQAAFTIPAGKSGLLFEYSASVILATANSEVELNVQTRENDIVGRPWRRRAPLGVSSNGSSSRSRELDFPIPLPEKTDVDLRVIDATAATATGVSGDFSIILIDNA